MRPELFRRTLDSVRMQTIRPSICVWNNGAPLSFGHVDWLVQSSVNKACWPRWFMALAATTEFVCMVDDDVILNDASVMEEAAAILRHLPENCILGIEGVVLVPGRSYLDSDHIRVGDDWRALTTRCDIVKGKFMLMRSSAVRTNLKLEAMSRTLEDDIAVSSMLAHGRPLAHVCAVALRHRFTLLDAPNAIWRREGHFARRDAACSQYFAHWSPRIAVAGTDTQT